MSMWLDFQEEDFSSLHDLSKERLKKAILELIIAKKAVETIETKMAENIISNKNIRRGDRVFVDFKESKNKPCVYRGIEDGKIVLSHIGSRNRVLTSKYRYKLDTATFMKKEIDTAS